MRAIARWSPRLLLTVAVVDGLVLGGAVGLALSHESDTQVPVVIREAEFDAGDLRVCRRGLEEAARTITIVRQAMIELNEGVPEFTAELVDESYRLQARFQDRWDACAALLRRLRP